MNNKVIVPILIAIIVIGGVAYSSLLRKTSLPNSAIVETISVTPSASTSSDATQSQSATTGSKDCGASMDCFIAQAATCGSATAEGVAFGPSAITASFSVKKTANAGICSITESAYGTKKVCSVPANKLVSILANFKEGNTGSDDLNNYSCTTTTSNGTSIDTTAASKGSAVATHNYMYTETEQVGGALGTSAFSYKILAIGTNSMTMSFSNNQTNQSKTLTLQQNVPVVFAKYTITLTDISQDGATFTLAE